MLCLCPGLHFRSLGLAMSLLSSAGSAAMSSLERLWPHVLTDRGHRLQCSSVQHYSAEVSTGNTFWRLPRVGAGSCIGRRCAQQRKCRAGLYPPAAAGGMKQDTFSCLTANAINAETEEAANAASSDPDPVLPAACPCR